MKKRKIFKVIFISALVGALLSVSVFAASLYNNGTYEGSGMGKFSNIVLAVTVTDDKIAAIDVVSQNETPNYWKKAVVLIDRIIEANSTDVDGITGATKSSNAIKAAVNNALDSARIKVSVQDYFSEFLHNIIIQAVNICKHIFSLF